MLASMRPKASRSEDCGNAPRWNSVVPRRPRPTMRAQLDHDGIGPTTAAGEDDEATPPAAIPAGSSTTTSKISAQTPTTARPSEEPGQRAPMSDRHQDAAGMLSKQHQVQHDRLSSRPVATTERLTITR